MKGKNQKVLYLLSNRFRKPQKKSSKMCTMGYVHMLCGCRLPKEHTVKQCEWEKLKGPYGVCIPSMCSEDFSQSETSCYNCHKHSR